MVPDGCLGVGLISNVRFRLDDELLQGIRTRWFKSSAWGSEAYIGFSGLDVLGLELQDLGSCVRVRRDRFLDHTSPHLHRIPNCSSQVLSRGS